MSAFEGEMQLFKIARDPRGLWQYRTNGFTCKTSHLSFCSWKSQPPGSKGGVANWINTENRRRKRDQSSMNKKKRKYMNIYCIEFTFLCLWSCLLIIWLVMFWDTLVPRTSLPLLRLPAKASRRSRNIRQDSNCGCVSLAGGRTQLPTGWQDDDASEGNGEVWPWWAGCCHGITFRRPLLQGKCC